MCRHLGIFLDQYLSGEQTEVRLGFVWLIFVSLLSYVCMIHLCVYIFATHVPLQLYIFVYNLHSDRPEESLALLLPIWLCIGICGSQLCLYPKVLSVSTLWPQLLQTGCGWICVHAGEGSIWSCMSCPLTPSSPGCRFPDLGLPGATCTVRYWECCLGDLETRSPAWLWIWASSSSGEGCTDLGCWVLGLGGKWCESSPLPT